MTKTKFLIFLTFFIILTPLVFSFVGNINVVDAQTSVKTTGNLSLAPYCSGGNINVELRWITHPLFSDPSNNNVECKILRNNNIISSISNSETRYLDSNVPKNTNLNYKVECKDSESSLEESLEGSVYSDTRLCNPSILPCSYVNYFCQEVAFSPVPPAQGNYCIDRRYDKPSGMSFVGSPGVINCNKLPTNPGEKVTISGTDILTEFSQTTNQCRRASNYWSFSNSSPGVAIHNANSVCNISPNCDELRIEAFLSSHDAGFRTWFLEATCIKSDLEPENTLIVKSSNPNSGVTITQTAGTPNGMSGITEYSRTSGQNINVTLQALERASNGNEFDSWEAQGACNETINNSRDVRTITVNISGGRTCTVTANYSEPPREAVLQVRSGNPSSGVTITQVSGTPSPNWGGGTTAYDRGESSSKIDLTLRALAEAPNGNEFDYWEGCYISTNRFCRTVVDPGQRVTVTARIKDDGTVVFDFYIRKFPQVFQI